MLLFQFYGFRALLRKEVVRILRIWSQTVIPPVITSFLYFLIFGKIVGDRIGEMGGVSYNVYIAPGLLLMAVITNSYGNVSSSFFSAKFQRYLEDCIMSPLSEHSIICAYIAAGIMRGLMIATCVFLVSNLFVDYTPYYELMKIHLIAFFLLFTGIIFALAGLFNGMLARTF